MSRYTREDVFWDAVHAQAERTPCWLDFLLCWLICVVALDLFGVGPLAGLGFLSLFTHVGGDITPLAGAVAFLVAPTVLFLLGLLVNAWWNKGARR